MIEVKKFLNYKQRMERLIHKKAFCSRMLFQALIDDDFIDEIIPFVEYFESDDFNPINLENKLSTLHKKTKIYYEKSKSHKKIGLKIVLSLLRTFIFWKA